MYELPTTIDIGEIECPIRNDGDYRVVLDCFITLQDEELDNETERLLATLCIFYADIESVDDVLTMSQEEVVERAGKMFKFFNCNQEDTGANTNCKVLDWKDDEQLVISAINKVAGREVRAEQYMHWWTFLGYYMNVEEGPFATVVSIRYKILKGKKLEKFEQDFRKENPHYFTWNHKSMEEKQAEQYIRELWESNSRRED